MALRKDVMDYVVKAEGGISDLPGDSGGHTVCGITAKTFTVARKYGLVPQGMTQDAMDRATISRIYERMYWNRFGCGNWPAPIDLILFDFGLHGGLGRTVQRLCNSRGAALEDDNVMGEATNAALRELLDSDGVALLAQELIDARRHLYFDRIDTRYRKGYYNRMLKLAKHVNDNYDVTIA